MRDIFETMSDPTCSHVRVLRLQHGYIADDDALCSKAQRRARYILALMERLPKLRTLQIWLDVDTRNEFQLSAPIWAFLRKVADRQPQFSLELTFTCPSRIRDVDVPERYAQFSNLMSGILTTLDLGCIKGFDLCFPEAPLVNLPLGSRRMPLEILEISTEIPVAAGGARWSTFYEACVSNDSLRHISLSRSNCSQAEVDGEYRLHSAPSRSVC